jgi:hypothetical protein
MTTLRLRTGAIALGLALGLGGFGLTPGYAQITAVDQDGAPVPYTAPNARGDLTLPNARLPYVHLAQAQPRDYVERETIDPPPYRPPYETGRQVPSYGAPRDTYAPPARADDAYRAPPPRYESREPGPAPYREAAPYTSDRYAPPPPAYRDQPPAPGYADEDPRDGTFSMGEITRAGHGFFGAASRGLASVIEYAFRQQGRPNGYILGEDAGGALVAGLRYGRGTLYTRDAGDHPVFWQGPSIGYDAGGDGSKVMTLVYRLRDPHDIYRRFGGVEGSAYVVGGVGMNFQANGNIVLAPIRTGIGLRMGANIGYLKYTPRPTWNPF